MIPPQDNARSGSFARTPWSVLLARRQWTHPGEANEMLGRLCAIYWRPIYVFVRASGYDVYDAQDLTQRFVLRLIDDGTLTRADRTIGRLRAYLCGALKNFLAHVRRDEATQKRGGGAAVIPLDEALIETTEDASALHGASAPPHSLDRPWAQAIQRRVIDRLAREYVAAGKAELYYTLRPYLAGEKERGACDEAALRPSRPVAKLRSDVTRLRARYRALVLETLRAQAPSDADLTEE